MTTATSTFTPSTQILEAGEQAQALADAGQALKPFFSPEIQETVDGVSKVADALNATGEALKHFGFDEAEDVSFEASNPERMTRDSYAGERVGPPMRFGPEFDVGDDPAMETLKTGTKVAIKGLEKGMQGPVRAVVALPGVIHGYADKENISKSPLEEIKNSEDKTKAAVYHALSPVTTLEEELLHNAQKIAHDPNAGVGTKILAGTAHAAVFVATKTVLAPVALVEQGFRWITSWFDEDEGLEDDPSVGAGWSSRRAAIFGEDAEPILPFESQSLSAASADQAETDPLRDSLLGAMEVRLLGHQDQSAVLL